MRKVFLDDLPRKGKVIDWVESVRHSVRFIYDDIEGFVIIVDYINKEGYKTKKLKIKYNDKYLYIATSDFKRCQLGSLLGKRTSEFKIEIGQVLKDDKRDIVIVDKEYRNRDKADRSTEKSKWYKYKCNKCGWREGYMVEGDLLRGNGCSCCVNRTAVLGINTIWDTDRWMVDLGIDSKESQKCTKSSGKKIKCICPHCSKVMYKKCCDIYNHKSIGCVCGDGFPYPEKFMYSVLKQLGIEFEAQLSISDFKWCGKYRYDFYIPSINMIIETHGGQHYKPSGRNKTLKQEQENDKIKKELALNNGIKYYLVLDCRESDIIWIKNSILESKLSTLFDLSNINWLKCEEFAIKSNRIKDVCDYWDNKEDWETTTDLINVFSIGRSTIIKYLKYGTKFNWCKYNSQEEKLRSDDKKGKSVSMFDSEGKIMNTFKSVSDLARNSEKLVGVKLPISKISLVCLGKMRSYKGFTFQYI